MIHEKIESDKGEPNLRLRQSNRNNGQCKQYVFPHFENNVNRPDRRTLRAPRMNTTYLIGRENLSEINR